MKLRTLLMTTVAASTLLLSGCWINETSSNSGNANNGSGGATQTVSAFAANNINTATCTNSAPQDVNSVNFVPDQTQTDVSTLTPACTPSSP
ncbi:MAG: hypothetical protein ACRESS_04170 [Stenotrophobium sp.]